MSNNDIYGAQTHLFTTCHSDGSTVFHINTAHVQNCQPQQIRCLWGLDIEILYIS